MPLYACHNLELKKQEETWRDLSSMERMRGIKYGRIEILRFMGAEETSNRNRHVVKSGCGRIMR